MTQQTIDIKLWVDLAQIITTLLTLAGVALSFWFSRKTLREVQKDRVIGQRPFLLFDYGGHRRTIEFRKHKDDKEYVRLSWPASETGGIKIRPIGKLQNLGTGPALDVRLCWYVEEIYINGQKISVDSDKRKELQYSPKRNENPIMTNHLFPNQESGFHLIPFFISSDFERKIERANGYLIIKYFDTYENKHETLQKFIVFTNYQELDKGFHVTFSDLITKKSHYS